MATLDRCRIDGCKSYQFRGTYYCNKHAISEGGVKRCRTSRKLEEIFSASLEGEDLDSAIASIPKRLDKFEGKWDQLLEWADAKYDPNSEENRRASASRELELIFSSALDGDELDSAIASIPNRLDKFHGKWDELLEWAGEKYGYSDKKIVNKESTTRKTENQGSGKRFLGFLLALSSSLILFVPGLLFQYPPQSNYSLLEARDICSNSFVAAFSEGKCTDVNMAFFGVLAALLLGLYLVFTPTARGSPRSDSPMGRGGKFCSECGSQFSGSEKFCSECGTSR